MGSMRWIRGTVAALALVAGLSASAAATRTYQVTGPVLEVTDDHVTIQKDKEKWEVARTADTRITGDLKVGAKVTVQYRMTAASVDVKDTGSAKAKPAAKK